MPVQLKAAVHLLLYDETARLLMLRRMNTGWEDGKCSLVAGHIEDGESAGAAMVREAKEEAGITIDPSDLGFVHVMHRDEGDGPARVDFFFRCTTWQGKITNAEPHKCDDLAWFDPQSLPANTVPYIRAALTHLHGDTPYSELGW